MSSDRRDQLRVSESRLITEFIGDMPTAAATLNVSNSGIYIVKPNIWGPLGPRRVQIEIPVPEASDSIWASGEVVYEAFNPKKIGTGIHLTDMASCHKSLLRDLVEMRRAEQLHRVMRELRWKKIASSEYTSFIAPPPRPKKRTPEMFFS